METSKMSALLIILMLCISSTPAALACGSCSKPPRKAKGTPTIGLPPVTLPPIVKNPPVTLPPVTLPPVVKPPVTLPPVTLPPIVKNPPVTLPPVTLPPVVKPPVTLPPVTLPPVTLPPVVKPPVTLPPVTLPPVTLPPVTLPPVTVPPVTGPSTKPGCAPPAKKKTCPADTVKLGACVDLLGGLIHLNIGKATKTCCPLLEGLVELDAAVCLCTTIKAKLLNLNLAVPLALQLLVTCGKTPPAGFTCS